MENLGNPLTGYVGVDRLRLCMIRSALKLWMGTGLQPTRGVRILKLAREVTGSRSRKADVVLAELDQIIGEHS